MNKVTILGRLTASPDVANVNNDETKRCRFTLAVPRRFNRDTSDFITCVCFGKISEFAEKYLQKGIQVSIAGHLQTGSYDFQITKNKSKRIYTTDLIVEEIDFADAKRTATA